MNSKLSTFALLVALATTQCCAIGQDANTAALKRFSTSDVAGIAYVDFENMDLDASLDLLGKLGFKETINFKRMQEEISGVEADITELKNAGIRRGYALLRISDLQSQSTSLVFPLAKNANEAKAKAAFEKAVSKYAPYAESLGFKTGIRDRAIIFAANQQYERLLNDVADDMADRSEMWKSIDGGSLGVVLFGDDDSRRVVKEMLPPLPGPFAPLSGELIADGAKWIGLSAKLDNSPALTFEIEATDEESAETFQSVIEDGLKIAKFAPQVRGVIPKSEIKFVFDAIAPQRDGTRVSMSASELTKDLDRLARVIAPQVAKVRATAVDAQLKNTLRQHILAILNYESVNRHFPAQYSIDAGGKPLLSWRVHVLPYLNENELYGQFKLDEPWDSEHNIQLVEKMPQIFWDMRGESYEANRKGNTIFQVPAGKGLVFDTAKKTRFADIIDGSSNTISVVAMPQEKAVPWTKPADWNVDLENPHEDLKVEGKENLIVAFCDGSIHVLRLTLPGNELRKLIEPADGEIIDRQAWK